MTSTEDSSGNDGEQGVDPEHKLKEKEFSLSRTAFIATTILAVIGAISTVVLAFVNVYESDQRADEDFRREQQLVAYSEFYAAATQIRATHAKIVDIGTLAVYAKLDHDRDDVIALETTLAANDAELSEKYAALVLVGSGETTAAADKVFRGLQSIYLNERFAARNEILFGAVDVDTGVQAYVKKLGEIPQLMDEFLEAGKKDIGVYG